MTKEEREKAIDLLDNLLGMIEDNQGNDYDFALKKGIEALKQESKEGGDIHLPLYNVGGWIESGTDGNAYKLYMSNGIEFEKQPYEDAVSRQAVLDLVNSDWKYEELEVPINCLPSVTPIRKEGYWIEVDANMYTCSNCSHCFTIVPEDNRIQQFNYCPNCKTKMQGVKE